MLDRLIEEGELIRQTCIQWAKADGGTTWSRITGERYV